MVDIIANVADAVIWVCFLLNFHTSKKSKTRVWAGSLLAIAGLIINIELLSGTVLYSSVTFLIDLGILMLYAVFVLEGTWYCKVFTILLYNICLFSCNFFCILFFTIVLQIEMKELIDTEGMWRWCFLLSSKGVLLVLCLITLYLKEKFASLAKWSYLTLVLPVLTIGIVSSLMQILVDFYKASRDILQIVWLMCLISALFVICVVLLRVSMREKEQKFQNRMLRQQLEAQERIYERQYKCLREVRKYQHDLKHKMVVVEQLLLQNNAVDAEVYLRKFLQETEKIDALSREETVWKTLIAIKAERARELGIDYEADVRDKGFKRIDPVDICIVLGNLLDNAIEAEEKVTEGREIKVKIREEKMVYIQVKNRVTKTDVSPKHFMTTKESVDMHGFGLSCIREVVSKYNGAYEFEQRDGWFQAEILF